MHIRLLLHKTEQRLVKKCSRLCGVWMHNFKCLFTAAIEQVRSKAVSNMLWNKTHRDGNAWRIQQQDQLKLSALGMMIGQNSMISLKNFSFNELRLAKRAAACGLASSLQTGRSTLTHLRWLTPFVVHWLLYPVKEYRHTGEHCVKATPSTLFMPPASETDKLRLLCCVVISHCWSTGITSATIRNSTSIPAAKHGIGESRRMICFLYLLMGATGIIADLRL